MSQKKLKREDLQQFTGTEARHRLESMPDIYYTDGAKYVAEAAGAHWILDLIVSSQSHFAVKHVENQVWNLYVHADKSARMEISDFDGGFHLTKRIKFTDFPLDTIRFYFVENVILLESVH